ncbi:MucR family transcriptional regulator [Devosia sp. 1635]|uniref:MucR family transcriptional regulator n=1 Tax=Devosia sp. 1635 TaxID=2726066 RepID=UPI0032C1134D
MAEERRTGPDLLGLTGEIVAAYVQHNSISTTSLPQLIQEVHQTLSGLETGATPQARPPPEHLTPAVPIKKSYTADSVTCLECGRKFTSLKRHIREAHGLGPEEYLSKWNLPRNYPMVAPAYGQLRSELAKTGGFGRRLVSQNSSRKSNR